MSVYQQINDELTFVPTQQGRAHVVGVLQQYHALSKESKAWFKRHQDENPLDQKDFYAQEFECKKLNEFISSADQLDQNIVENCPHCGSKHHQRFGKFNSRQRYRCKSCGRTFTNTTGTAIHSSKKLERQWDMFIYCFGEKYTLRKSAEMCDISLPTAFKWRHKILSTLCKQHEQVELSGVVEVDETYSRISFKGNSKIFKYLGRKPHKRGTPASKRGLSNEQVCIAVGSSLSRVVIADVCCLGKPSSTDIQAVFQGKIIDESILVTDSLRSYNNLAIDNNLRHISIPRNRFTKDGFNLNIVNNYHKGYKDLTEGKFMGVASKYINHYLMYHSFINFIKGSIKSKWNSIKRCLCTAKNFISYAQIKKDLQLQMFISLNSANQHLS